MLDRSFLDFLSTQHSSGDLIVEEYSTSIRIFGRKIELLERPCER